MGFRSGVSRVRLSGVAPFTKERTPGCKLHQLNPEKETEGYAPALRGQGPKGAPLLNLLYQHFSVGASGVALGQMHLLELKLEGNSWSNVQAFISKARYIGNGLKVDDGPSDATMFHWLWHEVKRVPCLSRITNKVRDSSSSSHRRSFQWLWDAIHDELKERREDSNYENLTKGLKTGPQAPPYGLAAGQADNPRASSAQTNKGNSESKPSSEHPTDKADRNKKTKNNKKGEKESQGKQAGPSALPAQSSEGSKGEKWVCSYHAAGFCRFGEACKLLHVGEPGSQKARQAFSESQKGKGNKGDGKGKEKGKKGGQKGGATATAQATATAAAASAPVGAAAQEPTPGFSRWFRMWEAFCEKASCVRLPIPAFLRITIPLMMACVDGLLGVDLPNANVGCFQNLLQNGIEMPQPTALPVGLISSSNNLEAIQGIADKYQRLSFELIGDTGAAHDIGSEEALTNQGLSPEVISSWKRTLENPLKFATAGGVQEAREVLSGWAGNIGELQVHLLKSCPLAMSIGKQIKKGRTFIWEFGKTPYIALNHKKCRVWCPLENRWFASRVKYDVPVFNVDLPGSGTEPAMPIVDSQDDVADAAEPDGTLLGAFVGSQESAPTSNDNLSQNATAGVSKGDSFTLQPDKRADRQHLPCNDHFGHTHEPDGSAEQDESSLLPGRRQKNR